MLSATTMHPATPSTLILTGAIGPTTRQVCNNGLTQSFTPGDTCPIVVVDIYLVVGSRELPIPVGQPVPPGAKLVGYAGREVRPADQATTQRQPLVVASEPTPPVVAPPTPRTSTPRTASTTSKGGRAIQKLCPTTGAILDTYPSLTAAAAAIGKSTTVIWRNIQGQVKTAGGYRWQYQA